MKISIAMATYNGEMYLEKQLDSILVQMNDDDELIISDDGSNDSTLGIIERYLVDNRIKLIRFNCNNVIKNFENAISNTTNEIIVLADQDDYWLPNKLEEIRKAFENHASLVVHDVTHVDNNLDKLDTEKSNYSKWQRGVIRNIIKNTYVGCWMAFRRDVLEYVLPFPNDIPMHDMWIGILAEMTNDRVIFINKPLMLYRRHSNTVTSDKRSSLLKILSYRYHLIKNLIIRYLRVKYR